MVENFKNTHVVLIFLYFSINVFVLCFSEYNVHAKEQWGRRHVLTCHFYKIQILHYSVEQMHENVRSSMSSMD